MLQLVFAFAVGFHSAFFPASLLSSADLLLFIPILSPRKDFVALVGDLLRFLAVGFAFDSGLGFDFHAYL